MWQRRLAWGSAAFVLFFVFTLMIGTVTSVQPASAAVFVSDVNNTMQNTKTAISTATTAINTATQISNQIKNLTSMDATVLLAHYIGLSQELSDITGVRDTYNGLMNSSKTMDQAWNDSFKSMDSIFNKPANSSSNSSASQQIADNQGTMKTLEQTYKDSMVLSKQLSDTSKTGQAIQTVLNTSSNATGIKEATQAGTQMSSLLVQEAIKTNQQLSNLIAIESAKGQGDIQTMATSMQTNKELSDGFDAAVAASKARLEQKP